MRVNLSVTDGVYGILSVADVKKQIAELGQIIISSQTSEIDELKSLSKKLLLKLEEITN